MLILEFVRDLIVFNITVLIPIVFVMILSYICIKKLTVYSKLLLGWVFSPTVLNELYGSLKLVFKCCVFLICPLYLIWEVYADAKKSAKLKDHNNPLNKYNFKQEKTIGTKTKNGTFKET